MITIMRFGENTLLVQNISIYMNYGGDVHFLFIIQKNRKSIRA